MTNNHQIRGVLPALITPFTAEGEVDESKLRDHLRFLIPRVHGLYPCGSYGSGPLMSISQREHVAEVVMEEVSGRIPVVLHVGFPDTRSTIELAKHAAQLGVAAVACLTPYYYLHNFDTVATHFRKVIDSVDVPVFLYHNPKYTNFSMLTAEHVRQLSEIGLRGIKDSSSNIAFFYDCVASVARNDFTFIVGSQTVLLPALVGGAHGCVSGLSNLLPSLVNKIYEYALDGDMERALELQRKANVLRKITGEGIPVPFYHAALKLRGIDIGVPRAPHLPFAEQDKKRIKKPIEEAIKLDEQLEKEVIGQHESPK